MNEDIDVVLPPNWTRHYDTNYNSYYYYNHITLETTWILPIDNNNDTNNNNRFILPPIDTNNTKNNNSHYYDYDRYQQQHYNDEQYNQKISPSSTKKPTMPAHMLESPLDSDNYENNPSAEYYSDMDSDDELCSSDDEYLRESGGMPEFLIPEQRGFLPYIHRVPKTPIVGGMNKDYIGMAKTYKQQYANRKTNNNAICTICQRDRVDDVFFPCEHRCVCRSCIKSQQICEEGMLTSCPNGYCMCPICSESIKLILEYENGNETVRYWTWVYEVAPALPTGFTKKFQRSAKLLELKFKKGMDKESRKKILASISGEENEESCTIY